MESQLWRGLVLRVWVLLKNWVLKKFTTLLIVALPMRSLNMINREDFKNCIDGLERYYRKTKPILDLLRDTEDFDELYFSAIQLLAQLVAYGSSVNPEWVLDDLEYFIYELDYGREYEPGMITDEQYPGNIVDFSDADHLYDYLVWREQNASLYIPSNER